MCLGSHDSRSAKDRDRVSARFISVGTITVRFRDRAGSGYVSICTLDSLFVGAGAFALVDAVVRVRVKA